MAPKFLPLVVAALCVLLICAPLKSEGCDHGAEKIMTCFKEKQCFGGKRLIQESDDLRANVYFENLATLRTYNSLRSLFSTDRLQENQPQRDFNEVVWDEEAAEAAQRYVEQCGNPEAATAIKRFKGGKYALVEYYAGKANKTSAAIALDFATFACRKNRSSESAALFKSAAVIGTHWKKALQLSFSKIGCGSVKISDENSVLINHHACLLLILNSDLQLDPPGSGVCSFKSKLFPGLCSSPQDEINACNMTEFAKRYPLLCDDLQEFRNRLFCSTEPKEFERSRKLRVRRQDAAPAEETTAAAATTEVTTTNVPTTTTSSAAAPEKKLDDGGGGDEMKGEKETSGSSDFGGFGPIVLIAIGTLSLLLLIAIGITVCHFWDDLWECYDSCLICC